VASPSERLAEVRAALLELEACVAKYRGVRVRRAAAPAGSAAGSAAGGSAAGGGDARASAAARSRGGGVAQRILRPRLDAFVGWWRKSRAKGPGVASASRD
jgi:hypothetical protein